MCIRDSIEGVNKLIFLLTKLKNTLNLSCGINFNWILNDLNGGEYFEISKKLFFVNDNPPVSYTHLDVYKRQGYTHEKQPKKLSKTKIYFQKIQKKN